MVSWPAEAMCTVDTVGGSVIVDLAAPRASVGASEGLTIADAEASSCGLPALVAGTTIGTMAVSLDDAELAPDG